MNTVIQTRIDGDTKTRAEQIFNKLGISLNDAIRMFLSQSILSRGLPFQPTLPDTPSLETIQAINEVENGIHSRRFSSVDELMADLESE